MQERPEQPPEGKLIAHAASRLDLSIREAARRANLSYGRWRQVVQGYQNVSPGEFAKVRAPAKTLAKMAAVVHVTPEQMETEGQRPDAAEIMRSTSAAPEPQDADADFDLEATEAQEAALASHLEEVQFRVSLARHRYPGQPLTGAMVFEKVTVGSVTLMASPLDEDSWNNLLSRGIPESRIPRLIAALRAWEAEEAAKNVTGASHN